MLNEAQLSELLAELCSLPSETEWVEFKHNNEDPQEIGEYISALSNAAALLGKDSAYVVWGIENSNHKPVGTSFAPRKAKVGNEELENWLHRLLSPRIDFTIYEWAQNSVNFAMLQIKPALQQPVAFNGVKYVRVGSYKKKLHDFPEKERALWALSSGSRFEDNSAITTASPQGVLDLIDYPACFELLGHQLPDDRQGILQRLERERVIKTNAGDHYEITNLGAILFAKDLSEFRNLARKSVRVIQYSGSNRINTTREQKGKRGYANGFEGLIGYIDNLLPQNEQIGKAFRKTESLFPELAIRELVPNMLIHQDFSMTGTGPMIEIFDDRIEFTNPGQPLIDKLRFIDEPPKSRNEDLASLMRRMNICEERGSGFDKVIFEAELYQLPAPEISVTPSHTRVTLFAPKSLNDMDREDRIRACYQHACLRYVSNEQMTNASFRDRLGVDQKNYAIASRIIRDTIDAGLVHPVDPDTGPRYMRYVPFWTASR